MQLSAARAQPADLRAAVGKYLGRGAGRVRIRTMRVASGKVVHGQIIYDGDFPEGADVTLIADDHEVGFEVDPELKKILLQSIAECDRGETISAEELLRELDNDE
jgi:hypothetical protein